MNSAPDPASQWQTVFDQIDAIMHVQPEDALKLCKQVFVESYLWEPPTYVRAAERYGKIMDHLGRSSEARDSLFAAQQAAQASCMPAHEAKILERLARGYYSGGDYRRAIQYWDGCIEVNNQFAGDAETWILAKVGLAQVYKGAGDYEAALTMLAEAQLRTAQVGDPHLDAKVKINLAVCLIERQRAAEAAAILHEAFALCSEHQLYDYLAESNLYLGKIALADGALETAMAYVDAGLAAARRVNFRWCEAHLLAVKAEVHAGRGAADLALLAVKEAQAIAIADGFFDMLIQQHFAAAHYAASLNDFATAFTEHKKGRDCEQRMHVKAPLERSFDLKEQLRSHQCLNRLLLDLSTHDVVERAELESALRLITEASSQILAVARVSLWLLDVPSGVLAQRCLHAADGAAGTLDAPMRIGDYPLFFERLNDPRALVAHDALHHPHTAELVEPYLNVHQIKSILVFPIRLGGQTIGALCFEGVGTQHNWTQDDLLLGKQLAEMSVRVITSFEHTVARAEINALHAGIMRAQNVFPVKN
ncbi:GAF domain-containing protein [Massilia sp. TWP1-3-3]|uniref:GAF domain-containing protein n=1 Tax=Massilia sp. TWP1-3-3 TaxID=2804573 RepID=UPI003CEDC0B5